MSFSVDQFMQVKCKLQLTSESESSESIHTNCEQVRLCATAEPDPNSVLIVVVCSNETSNNHILAYYIERRQAPKQAAEQPVQTGQENGLCTGKRSDGITTFAQMAQQGTNAANSNIRGKAAGARPRPKIVVKQIYYHAYNEDIVALCLSETANKLILISASSSIYILPIKNILLNLHAQQLRSSQGRSMYFYDATILNNLRSIDDPVDIVCWESSLRPEKSYIIVACLDGNRLIFIDVDEKKELCSTSVSEPIRRLEIVRDRFSYSLIITCQSYNQYRQTLELLKRDTSDAFLPAGDKPSIINLPKSKSRGTRNMGTIDDETTLTERDFTPSWSSKPLPIKLHSAGSNIAASAIHRVFTPASRFGSQTSPATSGPSNIRERPLSVLINQQPNLIGVIDILGANQEVGKSSGSSQAGRHHHHQHQQAASAAEARLLRFYTSKQYFYRSQRPQIVCRLNALDPNEMITHMILTERFIAFATDRDRCIINSRNCCKLKNPSPQNPIEMNPLVKEVAFNYEEKILALIKSPVTHDQDHILDSFILVTTRSIYSIDARHDCRDLFINLIDSHLAIKRTLFTPRTHIVRSFDDGRTTLDGNHSREHHSNPTDHPKSRSAESNLLINDFLQLREAYERICHDSLAFSTLFKLELSSLYETYADRLLQRRQFELANRFFLMANFDHSKILGKYIRIGAYGETIDYVKSILSDENDFRRILVENERIELAKSAFECLLAKLIVERSKLLVYKTKLKRSFLEKVATNHKLKLILVTEGGPQLGRTNPTKSNLFALCEHSAKGQEAKLSTTTIVGDDREDEEATLTSDDSSQRRCTTRRLLRDNGDKCRLECEKAFIDFTKNLLPSSLYDYAIDRLLDFDLTELLEAIAQTDAQIVTLIRALTKSGEDKRLLFRADKFEPVREKLVHLNQAGLIQLSTSRLELLEFITSPRVTRALVKDISLTCDFYGYQHSLVQFRKYSYAALRHLEVYKLLIDLYRERDQAGRRLTPSSCSDASQVFSEASDDNANDGVPLNDVKPSEGALFSEKQKQNAALIFLEFFTACLEESTEDSCRLWFNYINFYLTFIGSLETLEGDIISLIETSGDCRLAISLYRAIHREETAKRAVVKNGSVNGNEKRLMDLAHCKHDAANMSVFLRANLVSKNPLGDKRGLRNLESLFANEFLVRLLEKTLDVLPRAADLDAITIAAMC